MPGLLKIGKTTKNPNSRMRELNSTGVAQAFVLELALAVENCSNAEKYSHHILRSYRVNRKREFFKISAHIAIEKILECLTDYEVFYARESFSIPFIEEDIRIKKEARLKRVTEEAESEKEKEKERYLEFFHKKLALDEQIKIQTESLKQLGKKREGKPWQNLHVAFFVMFPIPIWLLDNGFSKFDTTEGNLSLGIVAFFIFLAMRSSEYNEVLNKENEPFVKIEKRIYELEREKSSVDDDIERYRQKLRKRNLLRNIN